MNKEIAKTNSKLQTSDTAWGAGESVDKSDILVPKINLLQTLSPLVADGVHKSGGFVENVNSTLLGTKLEFLVFSSYKTLQVWEDSTWKKTLSWQPEFIDKPYEDIVNGVIVNNYPVLNFYILLMSELADGTAFPYVLPFKKTGMKAGRKLSTAFAKLKLFKASSAAKVFRIDAEEVTGPKGKYWVPDVRELRNSTAAEVAAAKQWHDGLSTAKVKVKEDDVA